MPNGSDGPTKRAMLTVSFGDVPDEKVIDIKQTIEQMIEGLPDAAVDLRIGSVRGPALPSGR